VSAVRISDAQRRARLAWRHRLLPTARTDDPVAITRGVVALHASDPATVHLTATERMCTPQVEAVERALYDDRTLVRMLGMRRTMFVVPVELAAVVQASSTNDVAAAERRRLIRALDANGVDDPALWLRSLEDAALEALTASGGAHTTELTEMVPAMRRTITVGSGRWRTDVRMSSRVMMLLAADGQIIRGRPRGTWLSSQYRWEPTPQWLGAAMPDMPAVAARATLARRYLYAFGPATFDDLVWWTGWTRARTRRAVDALDTVGVELDDGRAALVLADDVDPVDDPGDWCALLPGLDPTPMGWKAREWYVGAHGDVLYDNTGNIGASIWLNGVVVGGWAQHADGSIIHRLLDDIDADELAAVHEQLTRTRPHLADTAVTPRFRSTLDRELNP
jgi:hypothetical protein